MAHNTTRRAVLATTGAGLAGVAGCLSAPTDDGGAPSTTDEPATSDGHGHGAGVMEPVESATVDMVTTADGHHFEPHVVRVLSGGSVTWVNESGAHTATAYHPDNDDKPRRVPEGAAGWDSGLKTTQGATFGHTFDVDGVYDYYCVPHEAVGMVGTVVVGEPDPHDQPGLAAPQASLPEGARQQIGDLNHMVESVLEHGGDHHED